MACLDTRNASIAPNSTWGRWFGPEVKAFREPVTLPNLWIERRCIAVQFANGAAISFSTEALVVLLPWRQYQAKALTERR
jgi:hypothetical protein